MVVAGQDADHEDPECQRSAVGAALVRQAVGKVVVFYPKGNSKKDEETGEIKSEETTRPLPTPIVPFDPTNEAIKEAIRDGEATIIDLGHATLKTAETTNGEDVSEDGALVANSGLLNRRGSAFSMRSEGQNLGAMLPPGTERSG